MPTLTEHIYVSILDRKIFYEAIRWLISERNCFNNSNPNRRDFFSFAQSDWKLIKLIQVHWLWVENTLEFFFKDQSDSNICHCLRLYSVQIAFRYFTRNSLCVSFHPHWILSSSLTSWPGLSAPRSEELPFLKLWGCGVSPLWSVFHRPGDFVSSWNFQTWTNFQTMLFQKDIGVDFLGAFKG